MNGKTEALWSGPRLVVVVMANATENLTPQQKEHGGGKGFHHKPARTSL